MNDPNLSSFIWSVADLLRGDYKQSEYGKVILPFTVLRRLDCVLEATKPAVLAELAKRQQAKLNPEPFLLRKSGQLFYNTSPLDMKALMGDQDHVKENLFAYMQEFSPAVRDIFESFDFHTQIDRLAKAGLLYLVAEKFANIDLHPETVSNAQMGTVFEELIRKFAELSNETAGEHFTPREVIRLMVNLIFEEDDDALTKPGVVRSLYDPTAGTGGMLSVAGEHLAEMNPDARLVMYGQELNAESYAICKADMLIKGQDIANIIFGNTLANDGLLGKQFDYMLSNPPFGVEWKKIEREIRQEHEQHGFNGRFGPGLPRVSDGSLLFLLHLISKMRPAKDGGSRFGIVLNGSPLVAEQQRLMELLKEKRQAVISHAVTKGLNPHAPMKPSGIEWLGEVPEHWEVKKVKHLSSRISSGKTPLGGSEVYVDEGVTFLRSQNVYDEGLRLDDVVFISVAVDETMAVSRVIPNDILLNITGASIGRSCVVPSGFPSANVNQHVCVIRLENPSHVAFVGWLFKSTTIKNQIDHAQNGAAREGLNFAQIGEMPISLPPPSEQEEIARFLDQETGKLHALTAEAQRAIELLQERRTALISAAVTGKIDVRGLAETEAA
jgi:type I restriction-modification system DNA methylase subunit